MRGNRIDTHIQTHLYYVHTHTNIATYIYFFFGSSTLQLQFRVSICWATSAKKGSLNAFSPSVSPSSWHRLLASNFHIHGNSFAIVTQWKTAERMKWNSFFPLNRTVDCAWSRTTKAHKCQRSVRWQRPDRLPQPPPASHQASKPPSYLATSVTRRLCCASSSVCGRLSAKTRRRRAQGNVFPQRFWPDKCDRDSTL